MREVDNGGMISMVTDETIERRPPRADHQIADIQLIRQASRLVREQLNGSGTVTVQAAVVAKRRRREIMAKQRVLDFEEPQHPHELRTVERTQEM